MITDYIYQCTYENKHPERNIAVLAVVVLVFAMVDDKYDNL